MEVLSSRVLLHPKDFERSLRFYSESLGLHIYLLGSECLLLGHKASTWNEIPPPVPHHRTVQEGAPLV
jgi:hypothetical protein